MEWNLSKIDVAFVGLYGFFIFWKTFRLASQSKSAADYFLAGRKMSWPWIGVSLFASNISSTTLIGLAGAAYAMGISVFNYEWMASVVLVFFAITLLPLLINLKVFTASEYLEKRYDARCRKIFSTLTIFLNIFVDTAGSLYAGGLLFKLIFPGTPLWVTVSIIALASGLYTIAGGLKAVMYTDMIQAILLLFGAGIILFKCWSIAGGFSAFESINPQMLSLIRPLSDSHMPWLGLLTGVPLLGFYFWCTNQFMVQRVLSAKNLEEARRGSLFAALLKLPVLYLMVLPGTFAILIYPNLNNSDLVYPTLLFDMLPTGILGIVLAGFIAALMSQVDSTLNSASTLVTMDWIAPNNPKFDQKKLMVVGRWVTFAFMLVAVLWAPNIERFGSLFQYLQKILSYFVGPVAILFLLGMFWPKAHPKAAFLTLVIGFGLGTVSFVLIEIFKLFSLHFLYIGPLLALASTVLLIVLSLSLKAAKDYTPPKNVLWKKDFITQPTFQISNMLTSWKWQSIYLLLVTFGLVYFYR